MYNFYKDESIKFKYGMTDALVNITKDDFVTAVGWLEHVITTTEKEICIAIEYGEPVDEEVRAVNYYAQVLMHGLKRSMNQLDRYKVSLFVN